jgi:hypothetical protein
MMIEIRRLAALDLTFLGPKIILPEFALGVLGPPALGVLTLLKSRSTPWTLFGAYLVALGANYVPLLLHAISITRRGTAQDEIAEEGGDQAWLFRMSATVSVVAVAAGRPNRRAGAGTAAQVECQPSVRPQLNLSSLRLRRH